MEDTYYTNLAGDNESKMDIYYETVEGEKKRTSVESLQLFSDSNCSSFRRSEAMSTFLRKRLVNLKKRFEFDQLVLHLQHVSKNLQRDTKNFVYCMLMRR